MKQQRHYALVVAIVLALGVGLFGRSGARHERRKEEQKSASNTNMPNEGTQGGDATDANKYGSGGDPLLNAQKNRDIAPTATTEMSPSAVIAIPAGDLPEAGRRKRENWSSSASTYAHTMEQRGVRVTGYLVNAKQSGPESCNDYSETARDFHLWVSDAPTDDKSQGVIVEMTPRWQERHPEWRLHTLQRLAHDHAQVRVTGWLMWDEEHANEVGRSRATQWEVHPITTFEVLSGGTWRTLAAE